ncbi:MAG: SdpI family protein [Clostridium sp.]|nr:SdpI family protein [Clostridium sp.]
MKKISNTLRKDWVLLMIIALEFIISAYFYKSLPNKLPIQWNFSGEANSYVGKLYGSLASPLAGLALYIMLLILPAIDPSKASYKKFNATYQFLKYLLVIFSFAMEIVTILPAVGIPINNKLIMQLSGPILIILVGNVMGRFRHNYFVGIKTPWTLASDEVWKKTHRMSGPLWVIGGILLLILSFTKINSDNVALAIILLIVVVPIVYSYIIYRKIYKI